MDSARFRQIEDIFHEALAIPGGSLRDRFLAQRCEGDAELLADVSLLVRADGEQAIAEGEAAASLPDFGLFRAESVLGRGGMGVIYLARRTDGQFDQLAAVKVLQPAIAGAPVREGFLRERRILAALRHPGIAQLLDGGFRPDGTPYLVMEYVEGERLDEYCRQHQLDVPARLSLFRTICGAVSFAHRNLVVHLDLKPSNILVTRDGHPKLLDFGTAKILSGADSAVTQAMATPRYASPEQLRGENAGVLSDVYSLGVVLAELLTGRWPFGDAGSRVDTMRRAVEDVTPTPPADTVVPEHAEACRISPRQLQNMLRGDLGVIVLKALENDPERRYHSVDEFSLDLERYAEGLPILARAQTQGYRVARFLGRHRVAVAGAALAAVITAGLAGYGIRQQRRSAEEGRRAKVLNTYLMRVFQSANPAYRGRFDLTVGELANRALSQADSMLAGEHGARAELGVELGAHQIFTRGVAVAGETVEGAEKEARQSGDRGLLLATLAYRSYLLAVNGQCDKALGELHEAREIADKDGQLISRERRNTFLENEAYVGLMCGVDRAKVLRSALDAVQLARMIPDNSVEESTPPVVMKVFSLTMAAKAKGCAPGEPERQEALAMVRHLGGMDYAESLLVEQESLCQVDAGQYDAAAAGLGRALELRRVALGADFPITRLVEAERSWAMGLEGKAEAAEGARAAMRGGHCELFPQACDSVAALSVQVLVMSGHAEEAMPVIRRLLATPVGKAAAQTCLLVIDVEGGQAALAEPYRVAARNVCSRLPAGSGWRSRIERDLDHME